MKTKYIKVSTRGNTDIIDITADVEKIMVSEGIDDGIIFLSVIGSTAGLTTMEYESGLIKDLKETFENVLPYKENYAHNFTWSDDNAHSHLRSSFIKTSLFVSVTGGKLDLGTWQQIALIDFDTRPRQRKIVAKIMS